MNQSSVSRSFSLELDTSKKINRVREAEKKRPFSHVVRDAVDEYTAAHHPEIHAEFENDRRNRQA